MNSPFSLSRFAAIATLISLLVACGQKGPLYLQAKPAPAPAPAAAAAPATTGTPANTPAPVTK